MTNEDKELLLKDLSGRLPYGVKASSKIRTMTVYGIIWEDTIVAEDDDKFDISIIKPYLRPMSSMTKEEEEECNNCYQSDDTTTATKLIDFYNAHHFDFRGLIPMGLTIEAPEGIYNFS